MHFQASLLWDSGKPCCDLCIWQLNPAFLPPPQIPRQFYGGCSWRVHAWEQAQRPPRHHPTQDVRSTHTHHLPPGKAPETAGPTSSGRGRRVGQQDHCPGPCRSTVPQVKKARHSPLWAVPWLPSLAGCWPVGTLSSNHSPPWVLGQEKEGGGWPCRSYIRKTSKPSGYL